MNEDINISVPTTRYHKIVNILSKILIIGIFAYLILNWKQIPDSVPGHFNGAGEIDRWGSKYELFMCPAFALGIYALISFIERYPSLWNTGVTVTKFNQARVYGILKNMIVTTKFVAVLALVSVTLYSTFSLPLSKWFLPVFMVLIFGPMGYFLILLYRKNKPSESASEDFFLHIILTQSPHTISHLHRKVPPQFCVPPSPASDI